ncbi:MAG: HAD-IA family hydrolase [Nitrosopumilus sp.]|nr:HAD-IA family hydrolase [Nitrosopumilus sp.]MDA7953367.1 HAD-IA family hydrolase [Nitrosopumilus sp.]MDA7958374.1 HAD-IA family hydrolase [Nitrosopumilus sp.]
MTRYASAVFDCDGVLVDVSGSYDAAIRATVDHVLDEAGIPRFEAGPRVIEAFKQSGGFNDEVDLAHAAILCISAASRAGTDPMRVILEVAGSAGAGGIGAVAEAAGRVAPIRDVEAVAPHPGPGRRGPLCRIFDQYFYGAGLYEEIYGEAPRVRTDGLISRDRLLVDGALLRGISGALPGGMALVTGRGAASARRTLGGLMDIFDLGRSSFLEDGPRELAKPDPRPLLSAVRGLGEPAVYVGDSVEDMVMAERARDAGARVDFVGITGACADPAARRRIFEGGGAVVLDSVAALPKALNLEPGARREHGA